VDKKSERFPRERRIRKSCQYDVIYKEGKKVQSAYFALYGIQSRGNFHRLGITVSRKIGNAVVRNKIKRWVREIFRKKIGGDLEPMDMVLNAKKAIVQCNYHQLEEELVRGSIHLDRNLKKRNLREETSKSDKTISYPGLENL
jgi:ribonuclease P protein component